MEIPYTYFKNKDLTLPHCVILAYILSKVDGDYQFFETDKEIFTALGNKINSIPTILQQLYKLGYIEIHGDTGGRIITYTYDAPHSLSKSGFIYIMEDQNIKDVLKIGYSKDPSYREGTLQAEKPTIKLLGKWKGSLSQEQTCHRILAKHRVRGEWFKVTFEEAERVIKKVVKIS